MLAQAILAGTIVTTFGMVIAGLSVKVALNIIEEAKQMEAIDRERMATMEEERDYVYMNDGTAVEFNEDDQE